MTAPVLNLRQALDPAQCGRRPAWLAILAADPRFPLAPGFVIAADAVARWGVESAPPSDLVPAITAAWHELGAAAVLMRAEPTDVWTVSDAPPPRQVTPRDAEALLRAVTSLAQEAASGRFAILVQRARRAELRGTGYSEDPRQDRVDDLHVEALQVTAPEGEAEGGWVRYRRPRAGGRVHSHAAGAAPLLSSARLNQIFTLLPTAERALGEPVSLEWALDSALAGGDLVVTGVGPILAPLPWGIDRSPAQPHDGWTRANAGEVFPKPMTPMTWSLTGDPLDHAFGEMYRLPGWTAGRSFVRLDQGYVYFNFGFINHLTVDRLGLPSREMIDVVGGPGLDEGANHPQAGLRWSRLLSNLPWILRSTRRQRQVLQQWPQRRAAVEQLADTMVALDETTLDDTALVAQVWQSGDTLRGFLDYFMEGQSAAFSSYAILSYLLRRWLGEPGLAARLVQGLPEIRTSQGNRALWELARRADDDPLARSTVEQHDAPGLLAAIRAEPALRWLADAIDAFLAEYGHRSAGELELMEPRWGEQPGPIIQSFRDYALNQDRSGEDDLLGRQVRDRAAALREVDQRLTAHPLERLLPLRRAIVREYAKWALRYAPLRENPKFSLLRVAAQQRRLLLALGARLVQRGAFQTPDDVFFLFQDELAWLTEQQADGVVVGRARSRVQRRRKQYAIWAAREPVPVLGARPPAAAPQEAVLRGIAASHGIAEGPARVAANPEQGGQIQPGEILVAKFTDPGWTHLFPLAAAVVTDIGGQLSHGAIVAREFGLPAVVNVRTATARIRTGDRIRVDGEAGTVEILQPAP